MKIVISVGHYPNDPAQTMYKSMIKDASRVYMENGVYKVKTISPIYTEYGICAEIAGITTNVLTRAGHETWLIADELNRTISRIQDLKPDVAIEIHLNDYHSRVTGCETLYYPRSDLGKELAENIQKHLVSAVGNRDRGIKEGWYWEGGEKVCALAFLEKIACPAAIIEPWFMRYEPDYLYNQRIMGKIAKGLLNGIEQWRIQVNN